MDANVKASPTFPTKATMRKVKVVQDQGKHLNSDGLYGWKSFRPKYLQSLNTPAWFLFFLCAFILTQGMMINGITSLVISTIEKRYGFSSVKAGIITSTNEISVAFIGVYVSHFGAQGHRPRWLGQAAVLIGLGGILFSTPQYFSGEYNPSATTNNDQYPVCLANRTNIPSQDPCSIPKSSSIPYFIVFIFAQILIGAGASPVFTLGTSFIEDTVSPRVSPVYLGIMYSVAALAPAIGFFVGGAFLSIYVDPGLQVDLGPEDPRWVGAWWMGFLLCGVSAFVFSVPLFGYPKKLPRSPTETVEVLDVQETSTDVTASGCVVNAHYSNTGNNMKNKAAKGDHEITNKKGCCHKIPENIKVTGEDTLKHCMDEYGNPNIEYENKSIFPSKSMKQYRTADSKSTKKQVARKTNQELQRLSTGDRNTNGESQTGSKACPCHRSTPANHRTQLPVCKRTQSWLMKLKLMPTTMWLLICNLTFIFDIIAMALEKLLIFGLGIFFPKLIESQFGVTASKSSIYTGLAVVPGIAGGTLVGGYLSAKMDSDPAKNAKFAFIVTLITIATCSSFLIGCPDQKLAGVTVNFDGQYDSETSSVNLTAQCNKDCQCAESKYMPVCKDGVTYFSACHAGCHAKQGHSKVYTNCSCVVAQQNKSNSAREGRCASDCSNLLPYLLCLFVFLFLTFLPEMPATTVLLKSVDSQHKSLALGLQWLVIGLLGRIPGPVLFGRLIDDACLLWQWECGQRGSCVQYSNKHLTWLTLISALTIKGLSATCFFLSWFCYRPRESVKQRAQEWQEKGIVVSEYLSVV